MKLTNKHNLPNHVLRLLPKPRKPKKNRMSVTHLIGPPRIRTLELEKWDEIVRDVSCWLPALGGLSFHHRAETFAEEDEVAEEKLEDNADSKGNPFGITLVGKADNFIPQENTIRDIKFIAVSALAFISRLQEFTAQLNCYCYQERLRSKRVDKLILDVFYRDWKLMNYTRSNKKAGVFINLTKRLKPIEGYPVIAYQQISLPVWSFDEQEDYVLKQLEYHNLGSMECPDEDRWKKDDSFAVMKQGRKSALRVLPSQAEALEWCLQNKHGHTKTGVPLLNKEISIVKRKGGYIRCCSEFCSCYSVCPDGGLKK